MSSADEKDVKHVGVTNEPTTVDSNQSPPMEMRSDPVEEPKPSIVQRIIRNYKTPGSALQIVTAAIVAIALGLIVSTQVNSVPEAATEIVNIPGDLWLRALKATVLPLIICAMIIAVQRLKDMADGSGSKLAGFTVGYYVLTTLLSISVSVIMTSQLWGGMFTEVGADSLDMDSIDESTQEKVDEGSSQAPHTVVKTLFQSFIPSNVFSAMANDELLAVLITAIVLGALVPGKNSTFFKLVVEIEGMVMRIITWLIKVAPIGVFFLILSNLMKLDIAEIGANLGMLIGGTLATMAVHVLGTLPLLYFVFTRKNPYSYWIKISPAWITAWGSASSAGTLPVTLRVAAARGLPITVYKFTLPLGCLINMDGTAIYFPMGVVFMAATQGHNLTPVDYVLIVLLATLSSIGTTPIPSASLVLMLMIADSVGVPQTGMFAVIVAIDWLLDRFRTAINVSGDLFGTAIITKLTGIKDPEGLVDEDMVENETRRDDPERAV